MILISLALAYLLGSIPFGYLLVRFTRGADVRAAGSGNIGATNVLRTTGKAAAIATLVLDMAKGFVAVWLAARLTGSPDTWTPLAALAVMAGHAFPVFLHFKGGKAVAAFIGAFLYLTPWAMLAVLLVFLVVVAATRHISAGSIVAAGTFPLAVWMILHPPGMVLFASLAAGVFILVRHKPNIERLRIGAESVFRWNKL